MVADRRWCCDYKLERGIYSTATGMYHDPSADLHARGAEHRPSCAAGTAKNVSFRACVILSTNHLPHQYALHAPDVIVCSGSLLHRLPPLLYGFGISPLHSRWVVRWRDYQAEFGCKSIGRICGGAALRCVSAQFGVVISPRRFTRCGHCDTLSNCRMATR